MRSFRGAGHRIVGNAYDAAGNLLNDGVHSYTYDGENRIVAVDSGTTAAYVYDAEGRRVRKTTSSGSLDYLYDLESNQTAEIGAGGAFNRGELYLDGRHVVTYTSGENGEAYFIHADWLGTERARTDAFGNLAESCTSLAFGDSLNCTGADVSPMHFTGKQRDTESNLDNFGARYYTSDIGRFMSPDWAARPTAVPYAVFGDPQSLNLYTYVRGDPVTVADLDGHTEAIAAINVSPGGGLDLSTTVFATPLLLTENELEASAPATNLDNPPTAPPSSPDQVKAHQQNSASPLKDKNGNVVLGASGQPALIPSGFDVNVVVKAGKSDSKSLLHKAEDLANFRRGGKWDLQRLSGKFDPRFVDSATILIGVYAGSAGITRTHILGIENDVAIGSHFAKGTPMDSTYTHLPVRNVTNTDIGMRLVLSGAIP